jgi:hypothetical protein
VAPLTSRLQRRPSGAHQHRGEALLAVGGGELFAGVPAPGGCGNSHLGFALDGGAAGPLAGGEMLGQLGGGQAIGENSLPWSVTDLHGAPPGIEQLLAAKRQPRTWALEGRFSSSSARSM